MLLLLVVIIVSIAFYFFYYVPQNYWKSRNVPFEKPVPIFGNMTGSVLQTEHLGLILQRIYNKFSNSRYFGMFSCLSPALVIRDPELLKKITVKDFEAFPKHRAFSTDVVDPFASKNLFSIQDIHKWRHMRGTLSPFFTGSKMKMMFVLMNKCCQEFVNYYRQKDETVKVDIKEEFTRYANDVIASTAFGISIDSLRDRDNQFFVMGKDVSDFNGIRALKFFMYSISPTLMKLLNITIFSKEATSFFRKLVKSNIQMREKEKIVRPDLIHLLMEARKGKRTDDINESVPENSFAVVEEFVEENTNGQKEISDDDITAQAMVFFLAGFDTVSTLMSFTAVELAVNPDIQQRLSQEIAGANERCGGKPSYEDIVRLKYLDMVVSESLRKWPPIMFTDRICAQSYTIPPEDEGDTPLKLQAGENVWIPIYAIHRDEKYYSNPDRFDPERFSDENKGNIKPFTYLPFGIGPRNCIASRFALLEAKIIFYHILTNFEIVPVEKTILPITLSNKHMNLTPKGGFILGLKKRGQISPT